MDTNEPVESANLSQEQTQAEQPTQPQQPMFTAEDVKKIVDEAIAKAKLEDQAKKVQEYNAKMEELVKTSQASIMRPNVVDNRAAVEYVKKVLEEDRIERMKSPTGNNWFDTYNPDSLKKGKIWLLKHECGLTEEQIAEEMREDLL